MLLYIVVWIILLLYSFKKENTTILWICILLLICMAGLRSISVGTDTFSYEDIYYWIEAGNANFIEPGWRFLNWLIQYVGGNFNMLLMVVAILTLLPVGFVIKQCSPAPSLSLFLYFSLFTYLQSYNLMRQMLAVSIVLLGYTYLYKQQRVRYLICVAFAMTFHTSALFSIPLIWIDRFNLSMKKVLWILSITLILGYLLSDTAFLYLVGPYAAYLENGYKEGLLSIYIQAVLINLLFLFIFYTTDKESQNSFWIKIFFIGIVLMDLTARLTQGTRITLFFMVVQFIVYPQYFVSNRVSNKILVHFCILLYCAMIFMKLLIWDGNGVCPYKCILFN